MILFNYNLTTYSDFLRELSKVLGAELSDNFLHIPEHIGEGFFKAMEFNGIDVLLYDFHLKEELNLRRQKTSGEFYTLIFEEFPTPESFELSIAQDKLFQETSRSSAIYLTSFLYDVEYVLHKDAHIKGIRVLLSIDWMKKYLQLTDKEDVLERYISLKTQNIWNKPIDAESKQLFSDVIGSSNENLLFYQNKIFRMVEIFFDWLFDQSKNLNQKAGISRTDVECVQRIESILTAENVVIPPTIKELSKSAAMSESKLKKVFKAVYGLPIYEYFQKHRMQKAKTLLLSGNYSIKDVGYSLGYANLSNFTLAFKKEFGKLPSEVVKGPR